MIFANSVVKQWARKHLYRLESILSASNAPDQGRTPTVAM